MLKQYKILKEGGGLTNSIPSYALISKHKNEIGEKDKSIDKLIQDINNKDKIINDYTIKLEQTNKELSIKISDNMNNYSCIKKLGDEIKEANSKLEKVSNDESIVEK